MAGNAMMPTPQPATLHITRVNGETVSRAHDGGHRQHCSHCDSQWGAMWLAVRWFLWEAFLWLVIKYNVMWGAESEVGSDTERAEWQGSATGQLLLGQSSCPAAAAAAASSLWPASCHGSALAQLSVPGSLLTWLLSLSRHWLLLNYEGWLDMASLIRLPCKEQKAVMSSSDGSNHW